MTPARNPLCFVAMPFGKEGTEDRAYFSALYEGFIRPVFEERGYDVARGDTDPTPGAIARDVILGLANASVVVADLSDLNPNVFYG